MNEQVVLCSHTMLSSAESSIALNLAVEPPAPLPTRAKDADDDDNGGGGGTDSFIGVSTRSSSL
jgi:hypothetical protein